MNATQLAERFAGHPFVDYFDCMTVGIASARRRSKRAVQARLAGDERAAAEHRQLARDYVKRAREWHKLIDWSEVNG